MTTTATIDWFYGPNPGQCEWAGTRNVQFIRNCHFYCHSNFPRIISYLAGRSGLAVTCLTAVREVLGTNYAVGSCVYPKNHCDLQPWARAVCTFPAVPRSTQPSTLSGMVNEYQLSGWLIIINGDGGCRRLQPKTGGLTAQVRWLGLRVGGCSAPF